MTKGDCLTKSFTAALAAAVFAARICEAQSPSPTPAASTAPVKVPEPPSAELVAQWAAFDKPVKLAADKMDLEKIKPDSKEGEDAWGKPIWVVVYQSPKESLYSYSIGIYAKGTVFGKNRAKGEALVTQIEAEYRKKLDAAMKEGNDGLAEELREFLKNEHVETRPGGRKVFITGLGGGPGGSIDGAFTTMEDYDVLVTKEFNSEHHAPPEERLKDPAVPQAGLAEVMLKVEEYLAGKKE